MVEPPRSLFDLLGQAARRFDLLLIGGFALQAYGVVRQTLDVDCITTESDETTLQEMLVGAGFSRLARTENFARFRHNMLGQLDVLFVDTSTFAQMRAASKSYNIGQIAFGVPALSHLIGLKLHAIKNDPMREPRDLSDIVELVRQNSFSTEELHGLCGRFGPPGIWEKLRQYV